jgi:DNA-directed RNA polymerase subunit RPC12/RpoP
MQIPANRMAKPAQRIEPTPPVAVERVLVHPPPEYLVKCPHCGAAGRWSANPNDRGTDKKTGGPRRRCIGCGAKLLFSANWASVRVVG